MRKIKWSVMSLALLWTLGAQAVETGVLLKPDEIKAEPFKDAKTLGGVDKGASVEILKKQGGWLQIKSGKVQGWVRMLSVKRGQAGKADAAKDIGTLATGRAGTGQIVSTTGVRGLSEEELRAAKFDEAQLKQAEANAVSAEVAQKFAASAKLSRQTVALLPQPAPKNVQEESHGRQ